MPRPQKCRRICRAPRFCSFAPPGVPERKTITLTLDEYEVIRLVDLEKKTHEQCAGQMDISRSTVQEIYENARTKLAACLVYGRTLLVDGGNYRFCTGEHSACRQCWRQSAQMKAQHELQDNLKGEMAMKIAVTYENGEIFQHFGHTKQFKIYQVSEGKVVSSEVVDTSGSGHGALAGFLMERGADILICGGIGGGAQSALAEAGIELYGGVQGNADAAVAALLDGSLQKKFDVQCNHHHHHGDKHEHHRCGEHGCGHHDCR